MILHVSASLSAHHQEFLTYIGFGTFYAVVTFLLPGVGWNCSSILLLVANGHHNYTKCTKADVRLRNPDDGQKGCPRNMQSRDINKIGIQCICWFYSQGIFYDALSYDRKRHQFVHLYHLRVITCSICLMYLTSLERSEGGYIVLPKHVAAIMNNNVHK